MIKRRLGEDFATAISSNLEIKAAEIARKDAKGGKRRRDTREKGDRAEKKPREQK
jgi:hypothetical protein